ncbi:uncharacterized protein LOC106362798 [Brassica napus]|uniref:uncharacterized protein LOC106362798 n=1 Tax=Brassica napus TaxID=3708 RepID=UPI0006AADEF8|nr:uncharacterized protein LOC106362798 [Brassica napus]
MAVPTILFRIGDATNTTSGSWVWQKLLKLRDLAKQFFKREVKNGRETSFWYDLWSTLGCLKDVMGERGCIALGISDKAVFADVLTDETCQHLFFSCNYSRQIRKALAGGILQNAFTTSRNDIVEIISNTSLPPTKKFLIGYTFQATVHALWRERNARRHGEQLQTASVITKFVDKTIRLKLLSVKGLGHKYLEESLIT